MSAVVWRLLIVVTIGAAFAGCQRENSEFALPRGNAEAGKQAFVDFRCNDCHSIADIEHTGVEVAVQHMGKPSTGRILVKLGGKTPRYRSHAELVTAVVNPSHKISAAYTRHRATTQSPMRTYNQVLSVENLIDIVEFLQAEYDVTPPRLIYRDYGRRNEGD